jgi:hypothetical protein
MPEIQRCLLEPKLIQRLHYQQISRHTPHPKWNKMTSVPRNRVLKRSHHANLLCPATWGVVLLGLLRKRFICSNIADSNVRIHQRLFVEHESHRETSRGLLNLFASAFLKRLKPNFWAVFCLVEPRVCAGNTRLSDCQAVLPAAFVCHLKTTRTFSCWTTNLSAIRMSVVDRGGGGELGFHVEYGTRSCRFTCFEREE